ncbi:pyridoxal-phosphate dependent enzyme [Nocardia sp. NPDC051570]|uniref:pyridoxal-phosphate dependent enzyme n=1 Tax=Nocardia sp. NPDC051570 TaxID=3364324 RepID=UPI00378735DB
MDIAQSVLDLIGRSPLVRLARLSEDRGISCMLAMKMETSNPGGSAKDRAALRMILAAEEAGLLRAGGTIVEPTSGNTGVGLAIVAAQRGYKCVFVVTDKVAPEKIALLKAYGARVVVCSVALPPDHPDSYYSTARRLVSEIPGAFRPNQYQNPANPLAHFETTGPELWDQTAGRITHLVAGAGTCGTLIGAARYLKQRNPTVQIVAADPTGSVYSGGSGRPYLVEGVGEDFFPAAWDPSIIDQVIEISDAESFHTARYVTRTEGVLIGGSGGLAVAAALRVAQSARPEDVIVVINPDSGRGYLSRVYSDDWLSNYGFLDDVEGPLVRDVVAHRGWGRSLIYVSPESTVREAITLMERHGVSQLPVCKNEPPFATAEVCGSVDELSLMNAARADISVLCSKVQDVMAANLPTIGSGQGIDHAVRTLETAAALLVLDDGRPSAVLTRSDILGFFAIERHEVEMTTADVKILTSMSEDQFS